MGVTTGMWGTSRMQLAFHAVYQFLQMKPVYKPEVMLAKAKDKFDAQGRLIDEQAKEFIRKNLEELKQLTVQSLSLH